MCMHYNPVCGVVLVGTLDFRLLAFDIADHKQLWIFKLSDSILCISSWKNSTFVGLADGSVATFEVRVARLYYVGPVQYVRYTVCKPYTMILCGPCTVPCTQCTVHTVHCVNFILRYYVDPVQYPVHSSAVFRNFFKGGKIKVSRNKGGASLAGCKMF